jgi:hypothetical protein
MILDSGEFSFDKWGATHFISVRVQRKRDGSIVLTYGGAGEWLSKPPYSTELFEQMIREKLALLMLAPVHTEVKGIGRRMTSDVYYIRMFQEDADKLKEENSC